MNFISKISKILNIDVEIYMKDIVSFYQKDNNLINQYYSIISVTYPQQAFENYYSLKKRTSQLLEKMALYKGAMSNVGYWDLLDKIDSIKQKLEVVEAYDRFNKVDFLKNKNSENSATELYILKQNETLENIQTNKEISSWEELAIFNNLKEVDYTLEGGNSLVLKSSAKTTQGGQILNSILDIEIGNNLLGKDLPVYYEIDDVENDLKVETPQQTNISTAKRLLELKKGSFPEFPDLGIQKDILSESFKGEGFLFPLLIRQLIRNFETDDTILNFTITNIQKKEDNLYIEATFSNALEDNLYIESKL